MNEKRLTRVNLMLDRDTLAWLDNAAIGEESKLSRSELVRGLVRGLAGVRFVRCTSEEQVRKALSDVFAKLAR